MLLSLKYFLVPLAAIIGVLGAEEEKLTVRVYSNILTGASGYTWEDITDYHGDPPKSKQTPENSEHGLLGFLYLYDDDLNDNRTITWKANEDRPVHGVSALFRGCSR
jgi:hypothetical protein